MVRDVGRVLLAGYKAADAGFEVPEIGGSRVSLGTQVHWQDLTQVSYFGTGPDSSSELRTDYALRTTEVIGFATYRPREVVTLEARVGRVSRPDLSSSSGPFDRGYPDAMLIFRNEPGFDQIEQPGFLHTQVSATADTRDHRGLPRRGGMYRAAAAVYSDRDDGRFSFRRYELEALHAIPLSPVRWTLAFHGWSVFSDTTGDSEVPAYMLPSLGDRPRFGRMRTIDSTTGICCSSARNRDGRCSSISTWRFSLMRAAWLPRFEISG